MGKLSLLKEYLKLLVENAETPFVIKGPIKKASSAMMTGFDTYGILRDFPVVLPPEALAAMHVDPSELVDGALPGQHEVIVDVETRYGRSKFKGNLIDPPDPDGFDIRGWNVVAIDGFELSREDAEALRSYMGDLTTDERAVIEQEFYEKGGANEPDDYDY